MHAPKKRPQMVVWPLPVVSLYRVEKKSQNFDINSSLKQGFRLLVFPIHFPNRHRPLAPVAIYHFVALVHLLLLVQAVFAGSAVHEQKEASDDGQNLEKIVFGEILVGVVLVKLE
jgi:hypothetical protein